MTIHSGKDDLDADPVPPPLDTLRDWPWRDTLRTLHQRFREDRLGVTASSLTFTTLVGLVPLVTVMLAVFTAFPMFSSFQGALETYFLQSLVPEGIAKPVLNALTQFAVKARQVGFVGLLLLGASALALMLTIDRTLNSIWRVRKPRPITQRLLIYGAGLTLGPLALAVSLTMTSYAVSASRGFVGALPGGVNLLLGLLEFGLLGAVVAGLYRFVPNTAVRWRHAWAGGLFVAFGFELGKRGLAWYVETAPGFSAVYGAFVTLPILLLWIYLSWVIVLLGAVIAAYAPSLQMRVVRRADTPGLRFELALEMLRELGRAHHSEHRGLTLATLCRRLRADPLQLAPVIELLV
ncbi:MAG: YihY family inner membrane protein, partial [Alphaproteobacteria bacterium]|nr:YihY family inner membrane protein [Alphaproteobacteria bacterium]